MEINVEEEKEKQDEKETAWLHKTIEIVRSVEKEDVLMTQHDNRIEKEIVMYTYIRFQAVHTDTDIPEIFLIVLLLGHFISFHLSWCIGVLYLFLLDHD